MKKAFKVLAAFAFLVNTAFTFSQAYTWEGLGTGLVNGTNGNIYAVTSFNGKIIVGGLFTSAGSVPVSNIAAYDPATDSWSALGSGTNGEIHSLAVYNSELIAGGDFTQAGGNNALNIARWNESAWTGLSSGVDGECSALTVFNGELIAGGEIGNAGGVNVNNIAKWNGTSWSALGSGASGGGGDRVSALTVYNSNLIVAGRFTTAGGQSTINIAGWTGAAWFPMSSSTNERLFAVGVHNGQLYAGGRFTSIGGVTARYIARWNGTSWFSVGGGVDGEVNAVASFKGELIVAGNFDFAGNPGNVFADGIAKFNGTNWQAMLSGMNDRVNALYVHNSTDTVLYAVGEFTSAGGKWCYHAAKWGLFNTSTVSGRVLYADNNDSVMTGTVKVVRMDVNSRQIITIDSARIVNGNYTVPKVPKRDSTLRVIVFPDDELDGAIDTFFVPTYYPSAIDWTGASVLYANNNLTNIDVRVIRRTAPPQNGAAIGSISGKVYLNILPPNILLPGGAFPFLASTIVYLKRDTSFVKYAVSNDSQRYTVQGLSPGTYNVRVVRLGYVIKDTNVVLGAQNIDSVNFHLDTLNVINAVPISDIVPKNFELGQNYPNPFNPVTKIKFSITTASFAELKIYSILGQEIASLLQENLRPGVYEATFNAVNLPSGVYFYRLRTDKFSETKKMILIK